MDCDLDGKWQVRNRGPDSPKAPRLKYSVFFFDKRVVSLNWFLDYCTTTKERCSLIGRRSIMELRSSLKTSCWLRADKKHDRCTGTSSEGQRRRGNYRSSDETFLRDERDGSTSTIIDADRQHPAKRAWNSVSVRVNGVRIYRDRNRQSVEGEGRRRGTKGGSG